MKATGIVRRIDDLGRVVIPKEIRRTLRIREGDPLEIFVDHDGEVILKKYSPMSELSDFAKEYAESLAENSGKLTLVSDRDTVIAVSGGSKKDFLEKRLLSVPERSMEQRQTISEQKRGEPLVEGHENLSGPYVVAPIIAGGDPIGTIMLIDKDQKAIGETEVKLAETAAGFLGRQMEH
ncbi:stage V sporulation protein T [Sporolactobacillus terrae]|uniref:Stage V sporulation protein T n=1 Tax=Sporolactobacillus terrae TaxID=269673 RepID=A0A410D541_9BACL|nr:stage V sporulation protein T [Sporolactobacillus terrae]QAA21222.1 stage V sporulation protein T [Sporolactobacillus terrae]QAA24194.1 stage V sporulation protein T [Sporolactobacillus terrae]UAK16003.1 stage V sporulation protein T [Sporolactobacillus terrae]BBN97361.1 stage V sporulation protein T [Sporolactobacillus terrae]